MRISPTAYKLVRPSCERAAELDERRIELAANARHHMTRVISRIVAIADVASWRHVSTSHLSPMIRFMRRCFKFFDLFIFEEREVLR